MAFRNVQGVRQQGYAQNQPVHAGARGCDVSVRAREPVSPGAVAIGQLIDHGLRWAKNRSHGEKPHRCRHVFRNWPRNQTRGCGERHTGGSECVRRRTVQFVKQHGGCSSVVVANNCLSVTYCVAFITDSATKCPLFPTPRFSINRTPPIVIPRSTALHMS